MDDLRDEVYRWSLNLVEKKFKLEGIFLLLSTWNFAYFRYHMIGFKLKEFDKALKNCGFDFFKDKSFYTVDLADQNITSKIKKIYATLSRFEGVKYVGATKIMHLINPKFFVMWDTRIIKYYKKRTRRGYINTQAEGYVNFLREMQKRWKEGKFKEIKSVTVPRAIDIYNMKITKNKGR